MANGYSQRFTLKDIFNNPKLAGKIPLVNYKEKQDNTGKIHRTTDMQSFMSLIHSTVKNSARSYYKPLIVSKSGETISVMGKLVGNYERAYNSIYNGLVANKSLLSMVVNNGDIIRTALKDSEKQTIKAKLWLRATTMQEIESYGKAKINGLMGDIMKNIYYSDNFIETQAKYNVKDIDVGSPHDYEERRKKWKRKVGEL